MKLFDLTGKTVLITGGYGHLGATMARGVADFGADVFVLGRSREKFDAVFADDRRVRFVRCDIADTSSIRDAYSTVSRTGAAIDALIVNGIYFRGKDPMHVSDDDWAYSIDGALNSAYRCLREAGPYFVVQGHGSVINISSMYGMVSPDFTVYDVAPESLNPPHYGAAKAALIQMTRYFAHFLGPSGVRVNAISPGAFPDPRVQENQRFIDALKRKTALGRIGDPADLIGAAVFLASDASAYVTGHNLVVDGGWTAA